MPPKFIFRIDEIHADTQATHDPRADWVPSTAPGANRSIRGGASGIWWYCNGTQIYQIPDSQAPSADLYYKTYSIYFAGGFGFWVLNGNASNPPRDATWQPLRFDHDQNDGYSSYLTNVSENRTLLCQRADQMWPNMLLPDIYHGPQTPYVQYGALKGELAIFLGLLAFSMSKDYVSQYLPSTFTNQQWNVHNIPRGWEDQRGVVVYLYTCPPSWDGGSTREDLRVYEEHGKYFH